jgi:hypothetical protein
MFPQPVDFTMRRVLSTYSGTLPAADGICGRHNRTDTIEPGQYASQGLRPVAPAGRIPCLVFAGLIEVHSIDVAADAHLKALPYRKSLTACEPRCLRVDQCLRSQRKDGSRGNRKGDGYKNGYSGEKRKAEIFVSAKLTSLFSVVRRGGLEPPRDCSR